MDARNSIQVHHWAIIYCFPLAGVQWQMWHLSLGFLIWDAVILTRDLTHCANTPSPGCDIQGILSCIFEKAEYSWCYYSWVLENCQSAHILWLKLLSPVALEKNRWVVSGGGPWLGRCLGCIECCVMTDGQAQSAVRRLGRTGESYGEECQVRTLRSKRSRDWRNTWLLTCGWRRKWKGRFTGPENCFLLHWLNPVY